MQLILGLGGNTGDPPLAFAQALGGLTPVAKVEATSALYRSEPVGPEQPRYWNMAALVRSDRPLLELLDHCAALEDRAGRDRAREVRWGPRPLDLDLLIAPHLVAVGPRLTLPHPRLAERAFALVPAAELAPGWVHPTIGRTLAELAAAVDREGLQPADQRP